AYVANREEADRRHAESLKEADRRKDEFLAILAHELRNPLAPILNAVTVLRLLGSQEPAILQARDIVERQARQLARLVDDLLDVTRISQGRLELRKERLELTPVVTQAVQTSQPSIDFRKHTLSVSLPREPVWLEADRVRLVQVLVNLLNNAARYTDPGGRITLTGEVVGGGEVVLRVRDTGIGIDPEMLGKVSEPFRQLDRSDRRSQGGLGIGLMLVRKLVEMHGGTVSAHSEGPSQGSEFVVRLPASAGVPTVASKTVHASKA